MKAETRFYCTAPSCPALAEKGKSKCAIHNGTAARDRYGAIIWHDRQGYSYCHDCKCKVKVDSRGICEYGHQL